MTYMSNLTSHARAGLSVTITFQRHVQLLLRAGKNTQTYRCSILQTDRQTDRTFIKINQSFAITMSLNSDPKETCAKT